MKLSRAFALPIGSALAFGLACSDPPSPPAQAAARIIVQPNGSTAGTCSHTTPPLNVPGGSAVDLALRCDPTKPGCDPDQDVIVDREDDASVSCTVSKSGDGYNVSINVSVPGSLTLTGAGSVTTAAGKMQLSMHHPESGSAPLTGECDLTVKSVKSGAILATFLCPNFDAQNSAIEPLCKADGAFIFENCDK